KIAETERASVGSGVPAKVLVEAMPGEPLTGSSKGVGALAANMFWEPQTTRQFSTTFALARPSAALRPGMTARVLVDGETLKNVTTLPRQVRFEKEGKPVVYVRDGAIFKAVQVKVTRITENRVVLDGLPADAEVALVNPDTMDRRAAGPAASGA